MEFLTMNRPNLPPILNTKEYKSLVEKYNKDEEKQQKPQKKSVKKEFNQQ